MNDGELFDEMCEEEIDETCVDRNIRSINVNCIEPYRFEPEDEDVSDVTVSENPTFAHEGKSRQDGEAVRRVGEETADAWLVGLIILKLMTF